MLFWTVVFFTMNLIFLLRNPFKGLLIKSGELTIEKAEGKITENQYNENALKVILPAMLMLPLWIGEIIYLINAIGIDPYKYPSIILLIYFIINIVLIKNNKNNKIDLSTDEAKMKYKAKLYQGRTIKSVLTNLIYCSYFGYMFYFLVF